MDSNHGIATLMQQVIRLEQEAGNARNRVVLALFQALWRQETKLKETPASFPSRAAGCSLTSARNHLASEESFWFEAHAKETW